MWLPETAVNYPTLQVLVQQGMKFLILSPFQALRARPLGDTKWIDVSHGRVDPTQPYRCSVGMGPERKPLTGSSTFSSMMERFQGRSPLGTS